MAIPLTQAITELEKIATSAPTPLCELLPLTLCLGRTLGEEIFCQKALPAFSNAAMDGYAIRLKDAEKCVKIKATLFAGDKSDLILQEGECIKIMTGAKIPQGTQAVIPYEEIPEGLNAKEFITLPKHLKENANIRLCGEEIQKGERIFTQGEELSENHLALLASQGISYIKVYQLPKIGIFSSGEELKEPWQQSQDYEIFNSNTTMIQATLEQFGFKSHYGGVLKDNKKEILAALDTPYDIIFTSGGASEGEADFMMTCLKECQAEILVQGIQIKPGKPIKIARLHHKIFIILPGNPLALSVLLRFLILPFLKHLSGTKAHYPVPLWVKNKEAFTLKSRTNAMLGYLDTQGFKLTQKGKYTSGQISPLFLSNALAIFDESCATISEDEDIKVLPYNALWSIQKTDYINSHKEK